MQFKTLRRPNEDLLGYEVVTEYGTQAKVVGISYLFPESEMIVESSGRHWTITSSSVRRLLNEQNPQFKAQQQARAQALLAAAKEENRARAQLPRPSRKPKVKIA
jgi:hypothetical protein